MMVQRAIMMALRQPNANSKWAKKAIFHQRTMSKQKRNISLLTASLTLWWLWYCIQLVLLPTVPIKLQTCTNYFGFTSTNFRRDCTEFTQMFHSSELGLTNKLPPKEELLSAPRMSSQYKHCTQKYILLVFQHLSICHLIWNRRLASVVKGGDSWNAFHNVRYCNVRPAV